MNISDESVKQSNTENTAKESWLRHWPYILLVLSVLASIATGAAGLQGLSHNSLAVAWFHVSVFLAVVFAFIGASQYVHDALLELKAHVSVVDVKEKSLRDAVANIEQAANNLRSDVRCEFAGDDEASVQYLLGQCRNEELQSIQGTLVRSDESHRQYSTETYKEIEESMRAFLNRPDTFLEEIVEPRADKKLVDAYINGAASVDKEDPNRVAWFRLHDETPMLNFLILTYKERGGTEKHQEVLFGGGRYASESGEAVFKSKDPRVVQEFRDLYQVLCNSSDRVPANALRDRFHRGAIVHETWEQSKLYELLNQIEPRSVDQIESGESDLRISTSFFIDYFGLRQKALLGLSKKGVRIEILLMNPENQELMAGRFALRKDGLQTERAKRDLVSDLRSLAEFTNIEVRLSDSMPCGYVVHSRDWVVFGLMPAHDSYVSSPMIEAAAGTTLWQMLSEDWKVRWDAAKPYEMHKSVGA